MGKPPEDYDNKILDDEGNELGPNEVGTIYMKAIGDKFEYYKDPDKSASSYRGDYFTLGDMGYFELRNYRDYRRARFSGVRSENHIGWAAKNKFK